MYYSPSNLSLLWFGYISTISHVLTSSQSQRSKQTSLVSCLRGASLHPWAQSTETKQCKSHRQWQKCN